MYKLTARRLRQIRNAQAISARKRKGRGGGRKLSAGHKRAIKVVAAGAVVAGGVYGTNAWMNKAKRDAKVKAMKAHRDKARWNVNARRLTRSPDMSKGRHTYKDALDQVQVMNVDDNGTDSYAAPSRVVRATKGVKVRSRVQNPLAQAIMAELHGTQVPGRAKGAKYKVMFGE